MRGSQPSLGDAEFEVYRRPTRRDEFLSKMDQVIPWAEWVGLIEPFYYANTRGRRPVGVETMLRMYLVQVWFHLSDEATEDAVNDSRAVARFVGVDLAAGRAPDATTLLHFRHLLEEAPTRGGDVRCVEPVVRGQRVGHARRQRGGRDDHRRPVLDEERHRHEGSGDAPDEEGQPVDRSRFGGHW